MLLSWICRPPSQVPRTPRRLEVVTSDRSVEIEHFSGEVEIRHALALHGPRIDFLQVNSPCGDLRLTEAQRARDGQRQALETPHEPATVGPAEGRRLAVRGQPGLHQHRLAQSPWQMG